MLSEFNKESLAIGVQAANRLVGVEQGQREGPKAIVDALLTCAKQDGIENHPRFINLRENREEAERFIAGLLGMM